jgi:hypothetical protein
MTNSSENRMIAAHLTAGLLAKMPITALPAKHAVELYNEVLSALADDDQTKADDPPGG